MLCVQFVGHTPYLFYGGGIGGQPPTPETISINGMEFAVSLESFKYMSQETMRDGSVTSSDQSEQLFNANGAWSRYRYSWLHGAGQEFADLREDADPFRFQFSARINNWNDYELELHKTSALAQVNTAPLGLLCESGGFLFYAAGLNLYRTTDLITWTPITLTGVGTISALSTDGSDLYIAHANGIDRVNGSNTFSSPFTTDITTPTQSIAFAANRLLAGQFNTLVEVNGDGTTKVVKTHFQAAFRWTTLFNIGSRIYIGGVAGIRSELYTVATDSTGALMQSVESAPLPAGEALRYGYPYAGIALLLTNKGVRMAQPGGDGTLTYGPLIPEAGDTLCASAEGQYAWVGWSAMRDGFSGSARIDLSTFVEPLLPAAAGDVRCGTVTGLITGIARYKDRTCMALGGSGCWVETLTNYEPVGTVHSGIITFGTVETKVLQEIRVDFEPLLAGERVGVEVLDEFAASLGMFEVAAVGAESFTYDLDATEVHHCQVVVTLTGPGTSTPTLKQWRMRAYPVVPPVEQWILPLQLYDRVLVNNGQGQTRDIAVESAIESLVGLWRTKEAVTVRIGDRAERLRVDAYEFSPDQWDDRGKFFNGQMVVRLVKA